MIGASIYGFVDYKQTSNEKEFKGMYTEKEVQEPVVIAEDNTTKSEATKKVTVSDKKTAVAKKKSVRVAEQEMLPGIKPVPADQKLVTHKKELIGNEEVTVVPADEVKVKIKKKRKVSTKIVSRAPLRDEVEEEIIPVKKDSKKTEVKEQ
jgi:hypothetical protein